MINENFYDVIVIGAGPAGLTAGIYLSRAKLSTLILNQGTVGGQLILTHEIANYPGVELTSGYKLASTMKKQALSFGAKIKTVSQAPTYRDEGAIKVVKVGDVEYTTHAVILTLGGSPRMLGVKGELSLKGKVYHIVPLAMASFLLAKRLLLLVEETQRLRKQYR